MVEKGKSEKNTAVNIIMDEFRTSGMEIKSILFFGSQAKGTAVSQSDWDFMVVVDREIERNRKSEIVMLIQRRLAKQHIAADIIVKSESAYLRDRLDVGNITYYAAKEGIKA